MLSGLWSLCSKGVPRFGWKRSSQLIIVGRNLETLDRNFPSFAFSLPGPKHQTNRARNFCPPSRTTAATFRHMAQGLPLHWLAATESKSVVAPSWPGPLDTFPETLRHSQVSHVLVARSCTIVLNLASENQQSFQFAIHSRPAYPYLSSTWFF